MTWTLLPQQSKAASHDYLGDFFCWLQVLKYWQVVLCHKGKVVEVSKLGVVELY
jgi:hypothetical protein